MPLVNPDFFGLIDDTNPRGTDSRTISDEQHKNIIASLRAQCPNWTGVVNATHADVNGLAGLAAAGTKPLPGVGGQTVVYFYLATPPPGYTPADPDANVRTLMVGGTGGTVAGSEDPSAQPVNTIVTVNLPATTGGHTLAEPEIPPHDHDFGGGHSHNLNNPTGGSGTIATYSAGEGGSQGPVNPLPANPTQGEHKHTSFGGGLPHSHPLGGTAPGTGTDTLTPRYAMGVLGQLDA